MKTWLRNFFSPSLWDDGERVDINYNKRINYEAFDIYQKAHFKRYLFALENVNTHETWGDFACGSAYGSAMLAEKVTQVIGADINERTVNTINKRYKHTHNLKLQKTDLRELSFNEKFDGIISFETLEHFSENDMQTVLQNFNKALKPNGKLIFSTPYMEERTPVKIKMGFHFTFDISEEKVQQWLSQNGFQLSHFLYQNYKDYNISQETAHKDFIIGIAQKTA